MVFTIFDILAYSNICSLVMGGVVGGFNQTIKASDIHFFFNWVVSDDHFLTGEPFAQINLLSVG